jgi:hypothetical protein
MVNALQIYIVNFIANFDTILYTKKIFRLDLLPSKVVQRNSAAVQSNQAAVQSNHAAVQTGGIRKTIHQRNKTLKLAQITRLKNTLSLKNI